ncbi:MAG: AMP-binding protein [Kofleriaceae bacterium]
MTLSIRDAARSAGATPAVITPTATITFAELAARADAAELPTAGPGRASPLVATADLATVVTVCAALERHLPLALVTARTPAAERAALVARVAAAEVAPTTAFVVFTSGSTGRAKGVCLSRAAALGAAAASAAHLGWRADDAWLAPLPLGHVGGLAVVVRCLVARRPIILDDAGALAGPTATLASLVPAQLVALLDDPGWRPSPRLRAVLLGGAAAPPALVARARARGVPVRPTYGMTETFGQVATADATTPQDAVGVPLPGVRITAGTAAAPAPVRVHSPGLMDGYLDEPTPDLTAGFATRDLGYLRDGQLVVVGRVDDVIITGGENVYPQPLEASLVAIPGVAAAAVVGLADARWGQVIAAAIVVGPGYARAALDAEVARWPPHQRPRRWLELPALPRLASGKVDYPAIAARFAAPSA